MRVVVTGGRDFNDVSRVHAVLWALHSKTPITLLIQGAQRGTDRWAALWRKENGVPAFEADWDRYGDAADPIRNGAMIEERKPDVVVSFPGGKKTRNNMLQARISHLEIIQG